MSEPSGAVRDGGAAFPSGVPGTFNSIPKGYPGMSLRDYFAAKALQKMKYGTHAEKAKLAYEQADAMLAERSK